MLHPTARDMSRDNHSYLPSIRAKRYNVATGERFQSTLISILHGMDPPPIEGDCREMN